MPNTAAEPQPEQPAPNLADQSFVTYEGDFVWLEYIEKLFAKYANGLTQKLGIYTALPVTDPGSGQVKTGFFRHGTIDFVRNLFAPTNTLGPVKPEEIAIEFPATPNKPSTVPGPPGPSVSTASQVTVVEASEELTLVQGEEGPGRFKVPDWSHLVVLGNVVCIKGKISIPGKHIVIFARELRTLATGKQQAELNVDGALPPAPALALPAPTDLGEKGKQGEFNFTSIDDGDATYPTRGGGACPAGTAARVKAVNLQATSTFSAMPCRKPQH
jgi:hypothetical protein